MKGSVAQARCVRVLLRFLRLLSLSQRKLCVYLLCAIVGTSTDEEDVLLHGGESQENSENYSPGVT